MSELRKPVVTLNKWGGAQRIVEQASYSIMCAAYPSLTVKHHTNTEAQNEAVEMTADRLFRELGEQQAKAFKGNTAIDTEVIIDTDDGSKLEFKGLATGDSYGFSSASVNVTGHALPDWSLVDMLNYSIYTDISVDIHKKDDNATSILDAIKIAEKKLVEGWDIVKKRLETAAKQDSSKKRELEAITKVHERNMGVRDIFLKILDNSKDTFGWTNIESYFKDKNYKVLLTNSIANTTMRMLVGNKSTFLNAMLQLANQFQCIYVPGVAPGDPGKLVNLAYLVAAEPEDMEIDTLVGTTMRAGTPSGVLPIGYTFVKSNRPADIHEANPFMGIAVPKETLDLGGAASDVQLPDWCLDSTLDAFKEEDVRRAVSTEPQSASIEHAKDPTKAEEKAKVDLGYAVSSIAAAYGLCHYAWVSLAHCRASITVPCTFKYSIGKRYRVLSNGKELFVGYLMGYNSNISAGSCLTELSFSHIMAAGFSLPGTSEMKEAKLVQ